VLVGVTATVAMGTPGGSSGPSSSESPYLVRSQPGVVLKSILTVGDAVPKPGGGFSRLVGQPDGLGAFDNGDGSFTLLVNHELDGASGAIRAHGARGAFVSRWTIRKDDLAVLEGDDLIRQVATWNRSTSSYNDPATGIVLRRLCSATLPAASALYNAETGKGFDGRIFMNGEEPAGTEGRAFGHLLDGTSYELPALGKASWENQIAHPATGDKTVVVGLDDSSPGQVYVYVGEKRDTGNPVERAGLTGGTLYGIKVEGLAREDTPPPGFEFPHSFTGHNLGDVSNLTGMQLNMVSNTASVTRFERPEDGVWSATDPHDFYFVTTIGGSRLWRLSFIDPADPAAGGTISVLLAGGRNSTAGGPYRNLDNITSTDRGQLVIQEDPGGSADLAAVWRYDTETGGLDRVAKADPDRFRLPTAPFTQEEESSGVIDVSDILGEGWFLLDVMAHYENSDPELVQGGQLLAMHIPPGRPVE
jgi:Bacterial protein of unknown function (DUF839)